MANRNISKEIAEYEKKIAELKLEEAKMKLAPVTDAICDAILSNDEAILALTSLQKNEVKVVGQKLAEYVTMAINDAQPEIDTMREKRARASAQRKARRNAAKADKAVSVQETDEEETAVEVMSEAMTTPETDARGWNGQGNYHSNYYGSNIQ